MNSRPPLHDTIYTVLLGVLAFFNLIGVVAVWFFSTRPDMPARPAHAFQMVAAIYICLLLLEVGVLIIRLAMPMQRKWPTVMLNIIILLLFPLGTALGIHGLWKVDRAVYASRSVLEV